ncbi:MAG: FG-GAP repeat protein [Anaerolineales bacterium]|nr:FG-GAP repeat protein [Anaerolineales bacterium]
MIKRHFINMVCVIMIFLIILSACASPTTPPIETPAPTSTSHPAIITSEVVIIIPSDTPSPTAIPIPETTIIDIANHEHDVTIFGEDSNNLLSGTADLLGVSLANGDFNGDGIMDILTGASGADGPGNERDHAGEVYIVFGEPDLPSHIDVAGIEGVFPDVRIYGEEFGVQSSLFAPGDSLGEVITTGDLNGDQYEDIIIASPLADGIGNQKPDTGAVYIIFGRSTEDWELLRNASETPVIFDTAGASGYEPDVVIHGKDLEDVLGCSLAAGDVNGDGMEELLVGACYADGLENRSAEAGDTYIFFGRSIDEWKNLSPIDLLSSPDVADIVIYGRDMGDKLGSALTSGEDVNEDGMVDFMLGAYMGDGADNAFPDAGEAYVFFGREAAAWRDLSPIDLSTQIADVTIFGADAGDTLSSLLGLEMADVNGDDISDLLISAPNGAGINNKPASGELYIILGRHTWDAAIELLSSPADIIIYGVDENDKFGSSLNSGDVNTDGMADILIGAPGGAGPENQRAALTGEAYMIFGQHFADNWVVDLSISGSAQITIFGAETYDSLGTAVTCGDINGDGVVDIGVSSVYAFGPDNKRPEAGEVYVIYK